MLRGRWVTFYANSPKHHDDDDDDDDVNDDGDDDDDDEGSSHFMPAHQSIAPARSCHQVTKIILVLLLTLP